MLEDDAKKPKNKKRPNMKAKLKELRKANFEKAVKDGSVKISFRNDDNSLEF